MPDVQYSSYPHGLPAKSIRLPDGTRVSCRASQGGDVPVILLHGPPLSSALWEKTQVLFPPRYSTYAPDLRGFGDSGRISGGLNVQELADDLLHVMKILKVRQAVVAGHSSAGVIAQHFAVTHPERVLALVLVNSMAAHLTDPGADENSVLSSRIDEADKPDVVRGLISPFMDPETTHPDEFGRIFEMGMMADMGAVRSLRAAIASFRLTADQLTSLKAPVLMVVGTHDPYGSFEHAVALSDIVAGSRISVMARSGHLPMWEKPIEFVKTITEFLSEKGIK